MTKYSLPVVLLACIAVPDSFAQIPSDPFPAPIEATQGVVRVNFTEFASIPDLDGVAARMMNLVDETGTRRFFVNDMRGPLYSVSYDGRNVVLYLNINDPKWGVNVNSTGRERGFQNFAFHPQFSQAGTQGFGKFYTYTDSTNQPVARDFTTTNPATTHDTVLYEWTARTPAAATYDGAAPRELLRFRQPFANHNGGYLAFNPLATPGTADFGKLYVGVADGGSGGDPLGVSQDLSSPFGKILRIDPLGTNGRNGKYGVPADNPFVDTGGRVLGEIYAYGVRNPQRMAWDPRNGNMFVADIGQNIVEEVSPVVRGGNLGWNTWEGSFRYISREAVDLQNRRADPKAVYPVVEYGQVDPLLQPNSAAGGLIVYRGNQIPQLANLLIFSDMPSGEIFYVSADNLPNGGQESIRRILLNHNGAPKTLLQVIQEKNRTQGKMPATRSDLRINLSADNRIFLLNKADGPIRVLAR
jgi:glucose/arabinose dehydrogenase